MARRVPIVAKLLAAYLLPTVAAFAGFGALAHYVAHRALEQELGRRLTAVAATLATQLDDDSLTVLAPGDEETRTYGNVKKHLTDARQTGGARRVFVFDDAGTSRADTDDAVHIGDRIWRLDADRAETRQAFAGTPAASVLFRGQDGALYKTGYAPIRDARGKPTAFAVGVEGAAASYALLAGLRRSLAWVGGGVALLVVVLSVGVARLLVRPVKRLERAAQRIGQGDLEAPVPIPSRDEIGLVAETLEAMRRQLRSRDERLQMMLAGIAHEVRNPLGGIALYAGFLRDELAADAEQQAHVRRIEKELAHLKTIVEEFLEYARRPRPELAPHAVPDILGDVRDLLVPAAEPRGVRVALDCAGALPRVRCDPGQLRRALLNLGQNAVQACPSGHGVVELGCALDGHEVVVRVHDNGAGIPTEQLEKIWAPFYTTKQSGTGLGLAFVRDIARDHDARLDVRSSADGTTFTLAFPVGDA